MKIELSWILEPMDLAQRYEDRLVLVQQHDFVASGDTSGALYHDPVLGAMVMHLQRQDALRFYRDPLDLEPRARSEEHTSELQALMRISYAVFCLKKKQS